MKTVILISTLFTSTLFFSANAFSETQCQQYQNPVSATYKISTGSDDKQQTLQIVRSKKKVIYHYPAQAISEQWYLQKNNNMGLTRYFDQYQRGIEYQAADMPNLNQAHDNWLHKYQLISPALIAQLEKSESNQEACTSPEKFTSKAGSKQQVSLIWDAKYQLPITLTIEQNKKTITWQLSELNSNAKQVIERINKYENFQLTDYSDIGDNEADPFLAKMINQGFIEHSHSGFYNADGGTM
jgi:hypothetical protein